MQRFSSDYWAAFLLPLLTARAFVRDFWVVGVPWVLAVRPRASRVEAAESMATLRSALMEFALLASK